MDKLKQMEKRKYAQKQDKTKTTIIIIKPPLALPTKNEALNVPGLTKTVKIAYDLFPIK